jgi:hypothetical protein
MPKLICVLFALFAMVGLSLFAQDEPPPVEMGTLVVVNAADKEEKVKSWSFKEGTKTMSWLAAPGEKEETPAKGKGKTKAKIASGPLALVVRDELKIHFLAGVVTLVPVDRLRTITFDKEKQTMNVQVVVSDKTEEDVTLVGTTAYKGINKLTIEAEVDKGEAGIAAVTYQGGISKGIKEVRFAPKKREAEKLGRPAVVTTVDNDVKKMHQVHELQALYQVRSGSEKLSSQLMFRKTLKVDLTKVKKIAASSEESDDIVWQIVQKDGDDSTLTLLTTMPLDGENATLIGLLGKVSTGYKLFPAKRISVIEFDKTEKKTKDVIDTE